MLNAVSEKAGIRNPDPSTFSLYTPDVVVGLFIQVPMDRIQIEYIWTLDKRKCMTVCDGLKNHRTFPSNREHPNPVTIFCPGFGPSFPSPLAFMSRHEKFVPSDPIFQDFTRPKRTI